MEFSTSSTRMDSHTEPLKSLPKQPLKSPTGARLVLHNSDAGYPDSADPSSPARGRWIDNIAGSDAMTFLRSGTVCTDIFPNGLWQWPAVVLMPEEYNLRVGWMSLTELRSKLEEYWGRGGVPGAAADDGYQDIWVPAWAPLNHQDPYSLSWFEFTSPEDPPLDPAVFSHWINGECAKWLSYFIAKNHTLGAVHAWFAAFLGLTRWSLHKIAKSLGASTAESLGGSMSRDQHPDSVVSAIPQYRMSFDLCMEGYDEAVDGIPSLPLEAATTIIKGVQVITDFLLNMYPRRIWDICANTVIPTTWLCGSPSASIGIVGEVFAVGVRPISHAWVSEADRTLIMADANQQLWPIPLPMGTQLEDVRQEMIRLGVRYAWLDVLCLRQETQPQLAKNLAIPVSRELVERREQCRLEEWKTDVPTIGAVYSQPYMPGLYGDGPTVIFMSGLGRPFRDEGWASKRHWLNRAWTLQETPAIKRCLIAGLPGGANCPWKLEPGRSHWPWVSIVCMF